MSQLVLPVPLQHKLTALARHVRAYRLLRGLCLVTLVVILGFLGVFALDLAFDFTAEVLSLFLAGLAGLTFAAVIFGLLLPMERRLDLNALAAVIERKYPDLAERLTSSVELTRGPDGHGSAEFIAGLLHETEERTQRLVFRHAFPTRTTRRLAAAAIAAIGLALIPAVVLGERYADFSERFLSCWFAPPALEVGVYPGDAYAALGDRLWWLVHVSRRDERVAWPENVRLVLTDKAGRVKYVSVEVPPGIGSGNDRVYDGAIDQVTDSFEYYVEAGSTHSRIFKIEAIEPLRLTQKPIVKIVPPSYVKAADQKLIGPSQIDALQYSTIAFSFQFNRTPVAATVFIHNDHMSGESNSWTVPVTPYGGSWNSEEIVALPSLPPGNYRLFLQLNAEQEVANTCHQLPNLTIHADQPPVFTAVPSFYGNGHKSGKQPLQPGIGGAPVPSLNYGQASVVSPDDAVHFKFGVADKEGLGDIAVEYRVNNGPVQSETIAAGKNALKLEVEHQLQLKGKVKDGDVVQFRIKAADNRNIAAGEYTDDGADYYREVAPLAETRAIGKKVPTIALGPQVVYYPANDQWLTLTVDSHAGSLQEQEIAAQHAAVDQQLEAIKKKIEDERKDLAQLSQFGKNHPDWTVEHEKTLGKLQKDNHAIKKDLVDLALKTLPIPELNPVSMLSYKLAKDELTSGEQALQKAQEQKGDTAARDKQLAQADQELAKALEKLAELKKAGEALAQDRLDKLQMEKLAQKEADLAQQVADLQANPKDDATAQAGLKKLQDDQKAVAEQLQQLAQKNPQFKDIAQKMQADHAQQLAKEAQQLAQEQKDLALQMDKAQAEQKQNVLDEFAKKQQVLADKATKLGEQTAKAAKERELPPLDPQPAHQAAASLKKAAVAQALAEQEQSARELERLAVSFGAAPFLPADIGATVKMLLKKQADLENRLLDEGKQAGQKTPDQIKQALKEYAKEQAVIQASLKKLVGGGKELVLAEHHATQAVQALEKNDALQAWEEMKQTKLALAAVPTNKMPPIKPVANPTPAEKAFAAQLEALGKEQWELRQALQKMQAPPDKGVPPAKGSGLEKAAAKQKDLSQKSQELMQKLEQLAKAQGDNPEAKQPAQDAAKSGAEAGEAMKKAEEQAAKGMSKEAKDSAEQAAQLLAKAAQKAEDTAAKLGPPKDNPKDSSGKAPADKSSSKSLQKGQQQAQMAKDQLDQGKLPGAGQSLKKAADALKQTAQQMGQPSPSQDGQGGQKSSVRLSYFGSPGVMPDLSKYGPEAKEHAHKPWGQLPGHLKSKILADLRADYGPEYAAIIQHYFEAEATAEAGKK